MFIKLCDRLSALHVFQSLHVADSLTLWLITLENVPPLSTPRLDRLESSSTVGIIYCVRFTLSVFIQPSPLNRLVTGILL